MSRKYFNRLNYTLANEDTSLEVEVLPENRNHVVAVAGSGGRVLPLLAKEPKQVTLVDLSQEQLYLCELRFESLRKLSHAEFVSFWGYPPHPAEPEVRRSTFDQMELSEPARNFLRPMFEEIEWEPILYRGRWEKTIAKLSSINRKITGMKGVGLFSAMNRAEHFQYMDKKFPTSAWALTLSLLGNASVFNTLLYKGHFPKKNTPGSSFQYYQRTFDRIFRQGPARENFLLQLLFFGRILFSEGNPVECDPVIFEKAKKAIRKTKVTFVCGNIVEVIENNETPVDFVSFSDVPSYFSGETEKSFMKRIGTGLAKDALVVIRNYLHIPEGTDFNGYQKVTQRFSGAINKEKVQMYDVEVYERKVEYARNPITLTKTHLENPVLSPGLPVRDPLQAEVVTKQDPA